MGASTAAFFEPYADDPGTSGLLIHDPDRLEQLIVDADADGFQPVVHAIGDRANTLVLDIFERLRASARRSAAVAAADRACAGRQAGRPAALQSARRDRVDSAQPLHRRHAVGRSAHRPRALREGLQRPILRRRGRARRVRDRLVRRAARPDDRSVRGRHAPVPGRDAGRRLVPGAAHHAGAGGRLLHARVCLRRARRESKGQSEAGVSRRPRRALARHLRDSAARDSRHPAGVDDGGRPRGVRWRTSGPPVLDA